MNMTKLVMLVLGITLILAVACGGGGVDSVDKETASQEESERSPQSSVAITSPTAIPSKQEWVTLTDIDKIFSISVPSHWETTIDIETLAVEYQSLYEQWAWVIFVGENHQTGSSVNVIADMQALVTEEPQPIDRDEYMQLQIEDLEQLPNSISEIREKEVTMDGIKGTQLRYVMDDELDQIINILLGNEPRMLCGSMGMLIGGAVPLADKYEIGEAELAVVEQIFNSFRVLPTAAVGPTCDDRKALSVFE